MKDLKEEIKNMYVNTVKKNNVVCDIQDARLPEAKAEDAGKALVVSDAGVYQLGDVGGEIVYEEINIPVQDPTIEDLGELVGECEFKPVTLKFRFQGEHYVDNITISGLLTLHLQENNHRFTFVKNSFADIKDSAPSVFSSMSYGQTVEKLKSTELSTLLKDYTRKALKPLPGTFGLDNSKTYVLKCVNGYSEWVEEA